MMMMRVFWSKNSGKDDFKAFLNVEDDFNKKKVGVNFISTPDLGDEKSTYPFEF
ncbi:uncharacterized protein DS421_8g225040 [Arachis hypogaea]|nr:uncharacterized protein DS421_8g225040 [Arachis hypogaea]